MRTRQEIFDLAWNGLKAQKFRQSVLAGGCEYRGPNGRKCAIGHCIPDGRYSSTFEGNSISFCGMTNHDIRKAAGVGVRDVEFAAALQTCHDSHDRPKLMEKALRTFAALHSLTIPAQE